MLRASGACSAIGGPPPPSKRKVTPVPGFQYHYMSAHTLTEMTEGQHPSPSKEIVTPVPVILKGGHHDTSTLAPRQAALFTS
jgi:hypothetical protein